MDRSTYLVMDGSYLFKGSMRFRSAGLLDYQLLCKYLAEQLGLGPNADGSVPHTRATAPVPLCGPRLLYEPCTSTHAPASTGPTLPIAGTLTRPPTRRGRRSVPLTSTSNAYRPRGLR